jgi:hypothetical protein
MYDFLPPTDRPFGNPNASGQTPTGPDGGGAPMFMRFMLAAGGAEHELSPMLDPNVATIFKIANTAEHTQRLGALLASRKFPNLRLKTMIFPDETHFTVPFALIPHGLRYVFGPR